MQAEELDRILHQKPFQPFRVVLKNGSSYEVRYRDLAAMRGATITIGTPTPGQEDPFADHLYNLDIADIIRVELLDEPATAETKFGEEPPMQAEELYRTLHRKPFQPFRVVLKDGRSYDIRYQRLAVVGKTYFAVGIPILGQADPFFVDHVDHLDLIDIDRLVFLDSPAPAETK